MNKADVFLDFIEESPEAVKPYLRRYKTEKIRLINAFAQAIKKVFKINGGSDDLLVSNCAILAMNTLDEIIDNRFLESVEDEVNLVDHLKKVVSGAETSEVVIHGLDPLKLKEIEFLCATIRERVSDSIGGEVYLAVCNDLASIVDHQILGSFESLEVPAVFTPYIEEVETLIASYGFDEAVHQRLSLATRSGGYSTLLIAPYSELDKPALIRSIFLFGAACQIIDDLLDAEIDQQLEIETFATHALQAPDKMELQAKFKALEKDLFKASLQSLDSFDQKIALQFFRQFWKVVAYFSNSKKSKNKFTPVSSLGVQGEYPLK